MCVSFICILFCIQSHCYYSPQERTLVQSLSLDEKIGQLLMIATTATPNKLIKPSVYTEEAIKNFLATYHIGGIIYLGRSTPEEQLYMTQRLQTFNNAHNTIDLWIGLDAEWGPAMRLDNTVKFPFNLTLGAIQDIHLIQDLGSMIGKQLRELGVAINFAPVADVNTNPENPIINRRSFGQDPLHTSLWAAAYAQGLEQSGIMACAKHFPGHGDTTIDSHIGLPTLNHDIQRMKAVELAPFQHLINHGIPSIMVGHLLLPTYDKKMPATLSYAITTKLLKQECAFNGLVVTDGLDMAGVVNTQEPGYIEVKALQAGADLLLIPSDVDKAFACIKQAVLDGQITQEELNEHVLKIIHAKNIYKQTNNYNPETIAATLNTQEAQELSLLLYRKAVTIIHNNNIPLTATIGPTAVILIGLAANCPFATALSTHHQIMPYSVAQNPTAQDFAQAYSTAQKAETIIIGLAGLTYQSYTNYGISSHIIELIRTLKEQHQQTILVLFGNPYALKLFKDMPGLIAAYEDHPYAQQAAAELLLGTIQAEGILPIKI